MKEIDVVKIVLRPGAAMPSDERIERAAVRALFSDGKKVAGVFRVDILAMRTNGMHFPLGKRELRDGKIGRLA